MYVDTNGMLLHQPALLSAMMQQFPPIQWVPEGVAL